jgi:membrane protease YdiL (CAAX protease family)
MKMMVSKWQHSETVCVVWCLLALATLVPVTMMLDGAWPVLTSVWLVVPVIVVFQTRDARHVGFRKISWREYVQVSGSTLLGLAVVTLLLEPWSHTYKMLIHVALSHQPPDTTFAWFLRFETLPALSAMVVYSGLVTMFAEELFFRGWLLQVVKKRKGTVWAVMIQALLFTLPNLLVTIVLPPLQSVLYVVYSFFAVGVIGGWAASQTDSIWPSLFSVTVANGLFVAVMIEA